MTKDLIFQMKELSKLGHERGSVLPVSEAFKLYPVEDEAHKGKIEYWTKGEKQVEVRNR